MNKLAEILQRHPLIIVSMFALSLLSSVVTIILGWEQFYNSFLSKEISIPIWAYLFAILIFAIYFIFREAAPKFTKELETIEGKSFVVQQVEMNGKRFVNCSFDGSELVFRGINGFSLEHNTFEVPPRISFQGNAGTTLAVMKVLYGDQNFRPYIEKTFE